jgi:hypothetical protein
MFQLFVNTSTWDRLSLIFSTFFSFWAVWLPLLLGIIFYELWMKYVRLLFISKMDPVLIEIKVPKEIIKSPAAMEIFMGSLYNPYSGTFTTVFLKGSTRVWFSLEIVSLGGSVRFFIWTPRMFKNSIESQLYSQYPNVEIYEREDYTSDIHYDPSVNDLNGGQLTLTKPDPYPIKTYIDYGLDKDPKEEFKIDPITPMIEFLGSLKPQEQAWIQILIQAHKEEKALEGRIFKKKENWKNEAKKEIKKIIKESIFTPEDKEVAAQRPMDYGKISPAEKDTILAIERSLSKKAFDTMIRVLYIAPKDIFSPGGAGGLLGAFGHFSSQTLNGFKKKWGPTYDYSWQDFKKRKSTKNKGLLLKAYKQRAFFNHPFKNFHGKPFILTTEELATIYHFPGEVSKTPTFERILSRKSEAPANLPI